MRNELQLEVRAVSPEARTITGVVAPYDETSYLVPDPAGERIRRGAFAKSIRERGSQIPLCVQHNHADYVGMSQTWQDGPEGLTGVFWVRDSDRGSQVLADVRDGFLTHMSVGFVPLIQGRGEKGVMEIREAKLMEVSLVLIGAYDGAEVLAVRAASQLADLLKPFSNPPAVNLSPIPPIWR